MMSDHRLDTLVSIFQASLHWKALLTASVRCSPNPPLFLGAQIISHDIRGKPLTVFVFF